MSGTESVLHQLVADAGLPPVTEVTAVTGHGFDHEILHAVLADSREVVLRHRPDAPRPAPHALARFLAAHEVAAPALLAGTDTATLYEYAPGEMLSALVDQGRVTDEQWHAVGTAFRGLHAIRFPAGLTGVFTENGLNLRPSDPVATLHGELTRSEPVLAATLPGVVPQLPRLHALIDAYADRLRSTPTVLAHFDVNPANIIVTADRATLIDWGEPRVLDPGQEIAALEEHVYLLDGSLLLPPAFYAGYGPRPATTALHRLTGAIGWYTSGDFDEWDALPAALKPKADRWKRGLAAYLTKLPELLRQL
ncbi:phosphotransferase family protein [Kribbella sp. CA-253562]|uniref:phosphotransferase family protein n=1 Tax=Kribbella sp. CA-253562 TaxID=3239942 RepID=UPI003D90D543